MRVTRGEESGKEFRLIINIQDSVTDQRPGLTNRQGKGGKSEEIIGIGSIEPNNSVGIEPNNSVGIQPNNSVGIEPNNPVGIEPNNSVGIETIRCRKSLITPNVYMRKLSTLGNGVLKQRQDHRVLQCSSILTTFFKTNILKAFLYIQCIAVLWSLN